MAESQTQQTQTQNPKWCPFGRLSIQRVHPTQGYIEGVSAFNQYLMVQNPRTDNLNKAYPATYCMGKQCALYDHGHCGLIQEHLAPSIYKAVNDGTENAARTFRICTGILVVSLSILTCALSVFGYILQLR